MTRRSFFASLAAILVAPKLVSKAPYSVHGLVENDRIDIYDEPFWCLECKSEDCEWHGHSRSWVYGAFAIAEASAHFRHTRFDDHSAHIAQFIEDGGHLL